MRRFVPWGSKDAFQPLSRAEVPEEQEEEAEDDTVADEQPKVEAVLPPGVEPLILWQPGARTASWPSRDRRGLCIASDFVWSRLLVLCRRVVLSAAVLACELQRVSFVALQLA
jgi:hypothetical protein